MQNEEVTNKIKVIEARVAELAEAETVLYAKVKETEKVHNEACAIWSPVWNELQDKRRVLEALKSID